MDSYESNMSSRITRRDAMCWGLFGAGSLLMGGRLASASSASPAETSADKPKAKAKSVIQIFLWGGMSHNDTWDPKPESGRDYMGEFGDVTETNVPGIRLGALFPQLAKQADKYSIIRGARTTKG